MYLKDLNVYVGFTDLSADKQEEIKNKIYDKIILDEGKDNIEKQAKELDMGFEDLMLEKFDSELTDYF